MSPAVMNGGQGSSYPPRKLPHPVLKRSVLSWRHVTDSRRQPVGPKGQATKPCKHSAPRLTSWTGLRCAFTRSMSHQNRRPTAMAQEGAPTEIMPAAGLGSADRSDAVPNSAANAGPRLLLPSLRPARATAAEARRLNVPGGRPLHQLPEMIFSRRPRTMSIFGAGVSNPQSRAVT